MSAEDLSEQTGVLNSVYHRRGRPRRQYLCEPPGTVCGTYLAELGPTCQEFCVVVSSGWSWITKKAGRGRGEWSWEEEKTAGQLCRTASSVKSGLAAGGGARRRRGRWGRSEPPGATLVRIARYCDSCRRPSFGSPRIRPEAPEPLSPPANQNLFLWATSITLYSVRSNLHTPPERHRICTDM